MQRKEKSSIEQNSPFTMLKTKNKTKRKTNNSLYKISFSFLTGKYKIKPHSKKGIIKERKLDKLYFIHNIGFETKTVEL